MGSNPTASAILELIENIRMKIYCVISKESLARMNGIRGKMMAQAGHAFLHAFWDAEKRFPEAALEYKDSDHARKITLIVDTDAEMLDLIDAYKDVAGITKVVDAGFTVFKEPTLTCVGIGPIEDKYTESLKKLKVLT